MAAETVTDSDRESLHDPIASLGKFCSACAHCTRPGSGAPLRRGRLKDWDRASVTRSIGRDRTPSGLGPDRPGPYTTAGPGTAAHDVAGRGGPLNLLKEGRT